MQTLIIVSIRDITANVFLPPMYDITVGAAKRQFMDACENKEHPIGKHPECYELYELGTWTDTNCKIDLHEEPIQLDVGANYRKAATH